MTEAQVVLRMQGKVAESEEAGVLPGQDDEAKLWSLIPKGGAIEAYMTNMHNCEAPSSYILSSALAAYGSACGRRVFLPFGRGLYTNLSIFLIGRTGMLKKSTVVNEARDYVADAGLCPVAPESPTASGLADSLVQCSHQFISMPEFSFSMGKQSFKEDLPLLLMRAMDDKSFDFKKRTGESYILIENPCVSFLGGSTLSLLRDSAAQSVLNEGFLNRMILVQEEWPRKCISWPSFGESSARTHIIDTMKRLGTYQGCLPLSPPAQALHDTWYNRVWTDTLRADERITALQQRRQTHVLKLALITHLVEHGFEQVCEACLVFGIRLQEHLSRNLPTLAKALEGGNITADLDYIVSMLRRSGGTMDHTSAVKRASQRMNAVRFKGIVEMLREAGTLRVNPGVNRSYTLMKEIE
jgi:hypothetical protein